MTEESPQTSRAARAFARIIHKPQALTTLLCGHKFHSTCIKNWEKQNPQCPCDRRTMTIMPSCSADMRKELLRSVKEAEIHNVRSILSTGFNPGQRSFLHRKNPLSVSLKKGQWEISAELIRAGATTGNKTAQYRLGLMHENGLGVEQNYAEALTWYRKAADKGYAAAQNNLGWIHHNGLGVEQNHAEALTWYRKAAGQGYAAAQNNLGWMHHNGLGVASNHAEALVWYRKAADQGCAAGQYNLGMMYQNGLGVIQNNVEAFTWYRKAADQGWGAAQYKLGMMNEEGLGV